MTMRKGYEFVLLGQKVLSKGKLAPLPDDFTIVTTLTTDENGNDIIGWQDDFLIEGHWAEIGFGFIITKEAKDANLAEGYYAQGRAMLRLQAWQEHELVRLGCYSWLKIEEKQPDASDVA